MTKLREYLNTLSKESRTKFVIACGTSESYLRKAISIGQQLGSDLCIEIDRESGGAVTCEELRPDVDWAYLRTANQSTNPDSPPLPDGADERTTKPARVVQKGMLS